MTRLLRTALPLATLLVVPLSATEAQPTPEITVVAPIQSEIRAWTTRVGQSIDAEMRYPARLGPSPEPQGVVDVTFKCSDDGTPTQIAVARSSGSNRLDRAGMQAVSRVKSLHPLPAGIGHDQVYRAQLLFAIDDGTGQAKQLAALREKANRNNAAMIRRNYPTTAAITFVSAAMP